jgi:hypothetical protein
MTQMHRFLLLASCLTAVGGLFVACSSTRRVSDGRTEDEHRRIAEACLTMLRSSLTNEREIQPDDPRISEIIRSLQPLDIQIRLNNVVILRAGKPTEYHLSHRPADAKPRVLYAAGEGYDGHQELIRLDHE